jgi:hypothetical protein
MSLATRVFTERRRVVLPLLVFLALNVAVLALIVFPLQRSVASAESASAQAALSLQSARKLQKTVADEKAAKARADVELKKFYTEILPKDFAGARNLTNFWLGRIAEESRLTYRAGQYDSEEVRGSGLMKLTGEVTLVGDYADIRRFLYQVETAREFVIIERVALSQPGAVQGGAQLDLALSVVTYFRPGAGTAQAVSR